MKFNTFLIVVLILFVTFNNSFSQDWDGDNTLNTNAALGSQDVDTSPQSNSTLIIKDKRQIGLTINNKYLGSSNTIMGIDLEVSSSSNANKFGIRTKLFGQNNGVNAGIQSILYGGKQTSYGISSYVQLPSSGIDPSANYYGIHSIINRHVNSNTNSWAGYFSGRLQATDDLILSYKGTSNTGNKDAIGNFTFNTSEILENINYQLPDGSSEYRVAIRALSIIPSEMNSNLPNKDNRLDFYTQGGLIKHVDNDATSALGVVSHTAAYPNRTTFSVKGDGKVFCTEVEVKTSPWPDYVFSKDYEILPLQQLKKYIAEKKHLPNIPSASELESGLPIGEMTRLQMEKIEELTLYIIDSDEEIQDLKDENKSLQERLDNLEKKMDAILNSNQH